MVKKRTPYLTKQDLLREIRIGKERQRSANVPVTPGECITNQLAIYFMRMVKRYASKSNWVGYSYNEEMQGEALVTLCGNALKFDESKSDNPFAYLTQVIHNSFLTYLDKERKLRDTKDEMNMQLGLLPSFARQAASDTAKD